MPKYKDESPAVRVYTVCDESRYLIVRNVPALGCGDELGKLFASYGDIEECKPMDAEDCDEYTDVYFINFRLISCARFAKRKLDEFVFLGNRLKVSYAPEFESLSDTKDKLESRRKQVLSRLNPCRSNKPVARNQTVMLPAAVPIHCTSTSQGTNSNPWGDTRESANIPHSNHPQISTVSSDKAYFPSQSMNQTVNLVREKLNKIQSSEHPQNGPATKKTRTDNRRRI
ncbi:hypothetical protein ACFE04_022972 [Oxalis oulophora]